MESRNKYGGGATTNTNGLTFENKVSLKDWLNKIKGIKIEGKDEVYYRNEIIGQLLVKNSLYKWFQDEYGVKINKTLSKRLMPDCAFFNIKLEKLFIIEVKYQKTSGSVDEKLQTFQFKKHQYIKMMREIEKKDDIIIDVEYIYVLSEWFKRKEYTDVLEYIRENGSTYYFDNIPINKLGIY